MPPGTQSTLWRATIRSTGRGSARLRCTIGDFDFSRQECFGLGPISGLGHIVALRFDRCSNDALVLSGIASSFSGILSVQHIDMSLFVVSRYGNFSDGTAVAVAISLHQIDIHYFGGAETLQVGSVRRELLSDRHAKMTVKQNLPLNRSLATRLLTQAAPRAGTAPTASAQPPALAPQEVPVFPAVDYLSFGSATSFEQCRCST